MAAIIGKVAGELGASEVLVEELIASHGDPRLLLIALIANGVYGLFKQMHPEHPTASIPLTDVGIPEEAFGTLMRPRVPAHVFGSTSNVFGSSIGPVSGEPITLRSRAKRGEPTPEQQEQAASRLGQAAAAASGPQSAEDEPELKDVAIDIPPQVKRLPRPIRRPATSAVKKVAAAAAAAGGVAAVARTGGSAGGAPAPSAQPGAGGTPGTVIQPGGGGTATQPGTGGAAAQPGGSGTAPPPTVAPPTPTTTQKVTPPGFAAGSPIGSTPLAELMRQGAQVPGRSSPYNSGTWIPPKRRAYTRELWYKIATANAAKLLAS